MTTQDNPEFFIGWDVGGWNCDKNSRSRDAVAILDDNGDPAGNIFRGNIAKDIEQSASAEEFLSRLFEICNAQLFYSPSCRCTIAIDAPLGFSEPFRDLISKGAAAGAIGTHAANPYLFRKTELLLLKKGWKPLSPVKDMIGSQTTKAMHMVAKFAPTIKSTGVWTDEKMLTVIETYPSVNRHLQTEVPDARLHNDQSDALLCAKVARLFSKDRTQLLSPPADIPEREGWIWAVIS